MVIRNIRLLYFHNFLCDFRLQDAFLAIYFAEIAGSYTLAMAVFAITSATSALMDIPTGILSDKMGRKGTMILASFCSTLSIVLYASANGMWALCLGGFLGGLSQCLFNGNNNALLFESLKSANLQDKFHHYQGRTSSLFQVGLGLSALIASFLTNYGLHVIFMLGIIPQVLSLVVSFGFQEPRTYRPAPTKNFLHMKEACLKIYTHPRLFLLVTANALHHGAGEALFQSQTPFLNTLWPLWALGLYRCLGNLAGFIGFWFSGPLIDRISRIHILIFRDVYWLFSQTLGLLMSNVATPLLFLSGAFVFGPGLVASDQMMQEEFTDDQRATLGSIASFAGSVVFSIVVLCMGLISDHFSLVLGVGFGVALCATSLPLYVVLARRMPLSSSRSAQ